ncbi:MAG: hypothetical protein JRI68_16690 [Deltaproteobacteria bacterium]|nr:hypothetical protein [Deltaproteobacteria bacterium]
MLNLLRSVVLAGLGFFKTRRRPRQTAIARVNRVSRRDNLVVDASCDTLMVEARRLDGSVIETTTLGGP